MSQIIRMFRDTATGQVKTERRPRFARSSEPSRWGPDARYVPRTFASVRLSPALRQCLPVQLQARFADLENAVCSQTSRHDLEQVSMAFATAMEAEMARVRTRYERMGTSVLSLPLADLAVYYLGSMYATLIGEYEEPIIAPPTGLAVLPTTDYATDQTYYTDFLIRHQASRSDDAASSAPGAGTAQGFTNTQHVGPLRGKRRTWQISARDIRQHDAARGRAGAPSFDLLSDQINTGLRALETSVAQLAIFGERPDLGVHNPNGSLVGGVLYMKTPVSLNLTAATGEANYANAVAFIEAAFAAANFHPVTRPNVFTIPPDTYFRLSHQYIYAAAGGSKTVLAALMEVDGLDEIRVAHEYAPNAAELANLTSIGEPMAEYYQGGVRVAGVQRVAYSLHRDDPKVITRVIGREPVVADNGSVNGMFGGEIATASGGCRLIHVEGLFLGYQPP